MTSNPSGGYSPLYDETRDGQPYPLPVDIALAQARRILAEKAPANLHDHEAMLRAAVSLEARLRSLVTALDAEAGR